LILLIFFSRVFSFQAPRTVAELVLALVILEALFDIRSAQIDGTKSDHTPSSPSWYPIYRDALPRMESEIRSRLDRNRTVGIKWLGVTGQVAWPVIQDHLLFSKRHEGKTLHAELALLHPDGVDSEPLRPQIAASIGGMSRFLEQYGAALTRSGSRLTAYGYQTRPNWHALLIDGEVLFYTPCHPKDLPFAGPQGSVEVVIAGSSSAADARIAHFLAWFDDARNDVLVDSNERAEPNAEADESFVSELSVTAAP
jgi:hypothetical protein